MEVQEGFCVICGCRFEKKQPTRIYCGAACRKEGMAESRRKNDEAERAEQSIRELEAEQRAAEAAGMSYGKWKALQYMKGAKRK